MIYARSPRALDEIRLASVDAELTGNPSEAVRLSLIHIYLKRRSSQRDQSEIGTVSTRYPTASAK